MAMTMTQKILAYHAGLEGVKEGDLIEVNLDIVLGNDITAPVAIKEMEKINKKEIFDKDKIVLVPDHFSPAKDIASAMQLKIVRDFAKKHEITHYFELGEMGIEHALLPEKGLTLPGMCIIGADSHTCTYGALGAFSTGVGSTDMACSMVTGKTWLKVPEAISFVLVNQPQPFVTGKDIILHIIGLIGVDGALYESMEFSGEGISYLTMEDRLTMTNMAIEAGAKNGIFPVDEITKSYLKDKTDKDYLIFEADKDAPYKKVYTIDLSQIGPTVAFPHLPENTKDLNTFTEDIKIDQVVIGSCTNGRIQDLRQAAKLLKDKKIARGVRLIVIPATQQVYQDALKEGLIDIFISAGGVVSTPTCGPCLGGYMGILAEGERCVSTTNRNFIGRMGHITSEIYLASPYVAAASAICGYLANPRKV